ncbi:hypothetical protein CWI37_0629p0010 [Hamiltosporidium tvaerminnensis]|uniref:Exportin-1/Importin-beta-like domain-containing protein n=1 Tax=Hamiltosporidium tvaerminnensis TaxID=1176355 RepID=A0A4Q9L5C1_9MICR|nr:hypothetical protein CWI37_0629p0010 [Hamiltosporidium tvaerminnensis]
MSSLKNLISQSKTDPSVLSELQSQLKLLITSQSIDPIVELLTSESFDHQFYGLVVTEQKLKHLKLINSSVQPIHSLIEGYSGIICGENRDISSIPPFILNKFSDIYALLAIYDWPSNFPHFLPLLTNLFQAKHPFSYNIFEKFLFQVNTNTDISEKRRQELKKSISSIFPEVKPYLIDFNTNSLNIVNNILDIYINLLQIISPNSLPIPNIFSLASLNPNKSLFLIYELTTLVDMRSFLPEIQKLIFTLSYNSRLVDIFSILLNHNRYKEITNFQQISEYAISGFQGSSYDMESSLNFYNILFKRKDITDTPEFIKFYENISACILSNLIRVSNEIETDITLNINYNNIVSLFTLLSKKYQTHTYNILSCINTGLQINRKLSKILIKNFEHKESLCINDPYIMCYILYIRNNPDCIKYLEILDFNDDDSVKLAIKIVGEYVRRTDVNILLKNVLVGVREKCNKSDNEFCDELLINIFLFYNENIDVLMNGEWNKKKIGRFSLLVKNRYESVVNLTEEFFTFFVNSIRIRNTDCILIGYKICGLLILKNVKLPENILSVIYESVDNMNGKEIEAFCNEFANKLEISVQRVYINKVVQRVLVLSSQEVEDEMIGCQRSVVSFLEKSILEISKSTCLGKEVLEFYCSALTEMVLVGESSIIRKIRGIFSKIEISTNFSDRLIFNLLTIYNSNIYINSQEDILNFCVDLLIKGHTQGFCVLDCKTENIESLRQSVVTNSRNGKSMVKEFLKNVKGKHISETEKKAFVSDQGFIKKRDKSKGGDVDISGFGV